MVFLLLSTSNKTFLHAATRIIFPKSKANYVNCLKSFDDYLLQHDKTQTPTRPYVTWYSLIFPLSTFPPACSVCQGYCCLLHPFWIHQDHYQFRTSDVSSTWNVDTKPASLSWFCSKLKFLFLLVKRVSLCLHDCLQHHLILFLSWNFPEVSEITFCSYTYYLSSSPFY